MDNNQITGLTMLAVLVMYIGITDYLSKKGR